MLRAGTISSAYRKPHTCWQHRAGLTRGVTHSAPARTAASRTGSQASSSPRPPVTAMAHLARHMEPSRTWDSPSMDAGRTRPPCSERWRLALASCRPSRRRGIGSQLLELASGNRCISVGHKTQISQFHSSGAPPSRREVHLHKKRRIQPYRRAATQRASASPSRTSPTRPTAWLTTR